MEMPATLRTSEDTLSPHKVSLKERSTTNWREKKNVADSGFGTLEQKRMSSPPMSRNNDDYSLNGEENVN